MRWSGQVIEKDGTSGVVGSGAGAGANDPANGQLALFGPGAAVRTFDTPEFRGSTFYEVLAKSVLNKVAGASPMFGWTINPYRGCGHRCVYCFARQTHTYLDLDAGLDFDSKIVVKVNAPELLRRELARPSWQREHVAMGTNVDCYQRAEGRYRLMPQIIAALADADTPFSILTKGTLILRDLEALTGAAERVSVRLSMSVGFLDEPLWRSVEAGTPSPARRLEAVRTMSESGIGCSVLMAPILPYLSDSRPQLRATVAAIAQAGARSVTPLVLHLRPGAREWFISWLGEHHPDLISRYRALYGSGSYAPKWYQNQITDTVRLYAQEFGLTPSRSSDARNATPRGNTPRPRRPGSGTGTGTAASASRDHGEQLTLM